ncbi:hypothetical protein RRG08_000103 [Elysia crispata]|uniref:Uncharacterized protein n=1 Tax=Elysia crispata TaxID=231223 RepID=A0AAE0Z459_9GAST|nr:hypothetical protein RRG08_000103 [Elysia crispata]
MVRGGKPTWPRSEREPTFSCNPLEMKVVQTGAHRSAPSSSASRESDTMDGLLDTQAKVDKKTKLKTLNTKLVNS